MAQKRDGLHRYHNIISSPAETVTISGAMRWLSGYGDKAAKEYRLVCCIRAWRPPSLFKRKTTYGYDVKRRASAQVLKRGGGIFKPRLSPRCLSSNVIFLTSQPPISPPNTTSVTPPGHQAPPRGIVVAFGGRAERCERQHGAFS